MGRLCDNISSSFYTLLSPTDYSELFGEDEKAEDMIYKDEEAEDIIAKDEEAEDMIHKDKEAEDMTNNDDAAQYDAATEHNATKFIYNHVTETKSKSILWQRKVKEKLTPNFYY